MLEFLGEQFQVHMYYSQSEATDIPPPPPTDCAIWCDPWPMPWWERALVFFRLRQRPYYTIMIPGNDGWSTWPVVGLGAIYMATGVIKPESGAATPLWQAPIKVADYKLEWGW